MFENFDEDLFNLRIILENFRKFWEIFRKFNKLFQLYFPFLTKICFYRSISISEINIKCQSTSRHSNDGAPPPVPPPQDLGARAPEPYERNAPACNWKHFYHRVLWNLFRNLRFLSQESICYSKLLNIKCFFISC